MKLIPIQTEIGSFQVEGEAEIVHIIKSGYDNLYIVTYEDGYDFQSYGMIDYFSAGQIYEKFGIILCKDFEVIGKDKPTVFSDVFPDTIVIQSKSNREIAFKLSELELEDLTKVKRQMVKLQLYECAAYVRHFEKILLDKPKNNE